MFARAALFTQSSVYFSKLGSESREQPQTESNTVHRAAALVAGLLRDAAVAVTQPPGLQCSQSPRRRAGRPKTMTDRDPHRAHMQVVHTGGGVRVGREDVPPGC